MQWLRRPRARWYQISLRTAFALFTILCLLVGRELDYYRRQNEVIRQLTEAGAMVAVRRHVPKWLYDLSGGRLRYVHAVDRRRLGKYGEQLLELEDDLSNDLFTWFVWATYRDDVVEREADIDKLLPLVSKCNDCHTLVLSWATVTDQHLNEIVSLKKLRALDLRGTQITDAGLVHLRGMKNLRDLNVSSTRVSAQGAKELAVFLPELSICSK